MKKILVGFAVAFSGMANADGYATGSAGVINFDGGNFNYYPGVVIFGVGYRVNSMLSIEGRVGTGLWDGYIDQYNLGIDSYLGVFVKPTIPVENGAFLYGLAGFGRGSVTQTAPSYSYTAEDSGFSFGAGFSAPMNVSSDITGEWVRLFSGEGYTVSQFALGVALSF